ncbi:MAG: hypothetical protein IPL61_07495 [Myxococcales bacterium]|nr:hypothetical protein [Myxococcales bacterium]
MRALVIAIVLVCVAGSARADLDGELFTSPDDGVRLEVPRGWRVSDKSGYPRVLLTLSRSTPRARIVVAIDRIVPGCRTEPDAVFCSSEPTAAMAGLRARLDGLGVRVTAQQQSRTPELEYDSNRRYVRHALIVVGDRVVSVILATDTPDARTALRRTFDRLTQSVRPLGR